MKLIKNIVILNEYNQPFEVDNTFILKKELNLNLLRIHPFYINQETYKIVKMNEEINTMF